MKFVSKSSIHSFLWIYIQVYEDPAEKMVEFAPFHTWQIGEENVVEYILPLGYDEGSCDWIGIYKVGPNIEMKTNRNVFK